MSREAHILASYPWFRCVGPF